MSTSLKFIIPLLDNNLTLQDLSLKAGFLGAYTQDINRPYLDNHIFLVYAPICWTKEAENRRDKFETLKTIYRKYYVTIDGQNYLVYAFVLNRAIKSIMSNCVMLSSKEKFRIISFWNLTDKDINEFMMNPLYLIGEFKELVLPEEDYKQSCELQYDKKRGALTYVSTPLNFLFTMLFTII